MTPAFTRRLLLGAGATWVVHAAQAQDGAIPNSSGTAHPRTPVPAKACDAHFHIIDARFPPPETRKPAGMTVSDYKLLQRRLGTTRAVPIQPRNHGTDHTCILDAIQQLGPANARGIGVLTPEVSDAELKRLHEGGIRGLRFTVGNPAEAVVSIDMIEPLGKRIADLGWHVQLHMLARQITDAAPMLTRLPCPIVFDHMGRLPPAEGTGNDAFRVIAGLLDRRKAWVKLAGAYLNTQVGPPDYPDATRIAKAYVQAAPDRLVWGSDWPHTSEPHKPDDAGLFDLLALWSGDTATLDRILVDNPATLYGFG